MQLKISKNTQSRKLPSVRHRRKGIYKNSGLLDQLLQHRTMKGAPRLSGASGSYLTFGGLGFLEIVDQFNRVVVRIEWESMCKELGYYLAPPQRSENISDLLLIPFPPIIVAASLSFLPHQMSLKFCQCLQSPFRHLSAISSHHHSSEPILTEVTCGLLDAKSPEFYPRVFIWLIYWYHLTLVTALFFLKHSFPGFYEEMHRWVFPVF